MPGRKLCARVQTFTIGATSLASACDFFDALRALRPTLVMDDGIYRGRIKVAATDPTSFRSWTRWKTTQRPVPREPARLELDGRCYLPDVAAAPPAPGPA